MKVKFLLCAPLLTSALYGADWLVLRPGVSYVALFHGKCSWYTLSKKVVWALDSPLTYVYWTMHHLDSRIIIDQLDVTCFTISLFNAQHVSNVSTSILRSLRLIC